MIGLIGDVAVSTLQGLTWNRYRSGGTSATRLCECVYVVLMVQQCLDERKDSTTWDKDYNTSALSLI